MDDVLSRPTTRRHGSQLSTARRPSGTILLVDDRSYDRSPIVEALVARRVAAHTLPNAERALALLRRRGEPLDALLCSGAMPECAAFVHSAATLRPGLRFVLLEDGDGETARSAENLERLGHAHRSFAPDTPADRLADTIVELLAGSPVREAA